MDFTAFVAFSSASVKRGQWILVAKAHLRLVVRFAKCATRLGHSPLHAKHTLLPTLIARALSSPWALR
eukprot:5007801-Amphidinium_carterae.1